MVESEANRSDVLVVGGGIAGLTAAWELARMGAGVILVERGPFIGGHSALFACKATDRCLKCNHCLVEERLKTISEERLFEIRVRTEITDIERKGDGFHATLRSGPELIDPDKCTNCGLCFERCPEKAAGAVTTAPSIHIHPFYAIDPAKCTFCKGSGQGTCESVCPEEAITLERTQTQWPVVTDGVVLATGYQPFDPKDKKAYKADRFRNMITGMDLEKMLRVKGRMVRVSDGSTPGKVALVQCVGSRDASLHHEFCSRVCCGYALRMGLKAIHTDPEIEVTVFYMDIQNFGKDFHRYYAEAQDKMRLLRGLPGDFYPAEDDRISVSYYQEKTGKTVIEDFDMVILSIGMMPPETCTFFEEKLGVGVDADGFLSVPEEMRNRGVVLAGAVQGPMDVAESISHGMCAALEMGRYLGLDKFRAGDCETVCEQEPCLGAK